MPKRIIRDPKTGRLMSIDQVAASLNPVDSSEPPLVEDSETDPSPVDEPEQEPLEIHEPASTLVAAPPQYPFEVAQLLEICKGLEGLSLEIQQTNPNRAEIKYAVKDRWRRLIDIYTVDIRRLFEPIAERTAS